MGTVDRLTRVNELIKRELAGLLERDIRALNGSVLLSVTEVKTSVDLRNAVVFVSVFGGDAALKHKIFREIVRRRVEWQKSMAKTLCFKNTPILDFKLDDRVSSGDRILQLLEEEAAEQQGHIDEQSNADA